MRGLGTSHRWYRQAAGKRAKRMVALMAVSLGVFAAVGLYVPSAEAQDPSTKSGGGDPKSTSFPKAQGGVLGGPVQQIDSKQPLYLQGDELIYDTKGNRVVARGNVEIFYNNYVLKSDEVTYDQAASTLTAVGNVELKEPNGNVIRAERYTLTDDFKDGFVQSLSVQSKDNTRIAAERAQRRDGNITEFQNGKFSPCTSDPGKPPLWCISAARIVHDQPNGNITYQDAYFELFGQKVLYLPFFQHPDPSVKRRSGFLVPEFSHSTTLGYVTEIPYFFNLAPNYDFTFHPKFTSNLGTLWQGDWRHKVSAAGVTGEYSVKLAGVDQTSINTKQVKSNLPGDWRGSIETKGVFSLSSWWKFGWDVTVESDDTFRRVYGLDGILQTDRVNSMYLQGLGERSHFSITGYQFGGLLLTDSKIADSRVLPVIDWNYISSKALFGGEFGWNVNAYNLVRKDGLATVRDTSTAAKLAFGNRTTEVSRATADVNWRRKLTDQIGITYQPFVQLKGDVSRAKDALDPSSVETVTVGTSTLTGGRALDETQTRGAVSAGVLAAYPWIANTSTASHIIEPMAQVIGRTARVSQQRIPDEDARSLVFDDTNLFELSKFSGYDRTETGTRANVGMQYTFQSNSGGSARLLAGQSYHLSGDNAYAVPGSDIDRKNIYNTTSGLATTRSDYVFGVYVAPSTIFRAIGQMRFDEQTFALKRADLMSQVNYGPISATGLYSFTSADPLTTSTAVNALRNQQQFAGSLSLKLTDRWSATGGLVYDIDERFRVQDFLQVKYTDDCFAVTASYTETFINNPAKDIAPDRSIMLRFEFKYLGDFRYKTNGTDFPGITNQATSP
jgi:LPS-assembly protein